MMDRSKALEKIKKCLRLAASSNPHEAAAAMRQAQALMEKYGIAKGDADLSDIQEDVARGGAKVSPAQWEGWLASTVASAYACHVLFRPGAGDWVFIGEIAEVASYTMAVLLRQARQARRDFVLDKLRRCKPTNKIKRADMFCEGWVLAIDEAVRQFANSETSAAVQAYVAKNYPNLREKSLRDRNASSGSAKNLSNRALSDSAAGLLAGRDVKLNHGVKGAEQLALH